MKLQMTVTPASGGAFTRPRNLLGCAIAALVVGAFAPAAYAANECGPVVAGAVTCTGTSFPNGVTYVTASGTTITAAPGASVTTTAANTNGIDILGTGPTTLAGAANVTVSGINSNGVVVTSATGPVTVNTGQVTVTRTGGNAIFAQSDGPVTVNTAGASSIDYPAVYAHSLASTATVNVTGGTVSSATSDGIDIASATGSTVTNNGTIVGGRYAVIASGAGRATVTNNGTITGPLSLAGTGSTVNNNGTFNAVGTSVFGTNSVFNNAGTLTVGAGSAAPVSASLQGLTTFNNTGTIDLRNGVAGNVLTIPGNYVGSGASALALEAGPAANDRLVVAGNASGTTLVTVTQLPGATPVFSNGSVFVAGGAGSTAGAFVVAPGSVNAGLVRYDVAYNGANGTYSLVATPGDAAYNTMRYGTAERTLWNKSADAISAHMQSRRDALWAQGDNSGASGKFWLTMAGSVDRTRNRRDFAGFGRNTDTGYSQDVIGGQFGMDLSGGVGTRGGFAFGVTGGYFNSNVNFRSGPDSLNTDAVNGGAYMSFTSGTLFINGLAKYDYYWMDAQSGLAGFSRRLHGHAWGARGEIGMRLGGDQFFVEPLGQLSWVNTSLDRMSVFGTDVDFNDRDGFRVKAGGRVGGVMPLGGDGTRMSYYLGASYVHDFRREGDVTFTNAGGTYRMAGYKTPDAIEGVLGWNIASNRAVSGFMEGTYTRSFHGDWSTGQRTEGFGGRAGVNVRF